MPTARPAPAAIPSATPPASLSLSTIVLMILFMPH
jgi:hypothetical protein